MQTGSSSQPNQPMCLNRATTENNRYIYTAVSVWIYIYVDIYVVAALVI